jgi:hypothetical protein
MVTLRASLYTKDTPIAKPVTSDCGFLNASGVNGLSEITMRPLKLLVATGVGLVSYAP